MEIKEFKPTENIAFNPPKKMWVWNTDAFENKSIALVSAVICSNIGIRTLAKTGHIFDHCAEIVEEKPKMMTRRQITEWLAKGNGEAKDGHGNVANNYYYLVGAENKPLEYELEVRKFGSEKWEPATVEVYKRDCQ